MGQVVGSVALVQHAGRSTPGFVVIAAEHIGFRAVVVKEPVWFHEYANQ